MYREEKFSVADIEEPLFARQPPEDLLPQCLYVALQKRIWLMLPGLAVFVMVVPAASAATVAVTWSVARPFSTNSPTFHAPDARV